MRILDLFCGGGASALGLRWYWPEAEIVGVDKFEQPYYPFTFYQANAIDFDLRGYDYIWASPPCQAYSKAKSLTTRESVALIDFIRGRLQAQSAPWCIESVAGWPLRHPSMLCGAMFGLGVYRHRYFETSYPVRQLQHPKHVAKQARLGERALPGEMLYVVGHFPGSEEGRVAMGVPYFLPRSALAQAIPPDYSRYIAQSLES